MFSIYSRVRRDFVQNQHEGAFKLHQACTSTGCTELKNPEVPAISKKVVAVRGETRPGFLELHLGIFDAKGIPTADPGEVVFLPINPAMRPTANRIMAGIETEEDTKVIELALANMV